MEKRASWNHVFSDSQLAEYLDKFDGIKTLNGMAQSEDWGEHTDINTDISELRKEHAKAYQPVRIGHNGDLRENLAVVYGDGGDTKKLDQKWHLYQQTLNKWIYGFLAIEGLDRLFSEYYLWMEWMLYLDFNFEESCEGYYRDHFLHQIRVAYQGLVILEEEGLLHRHARHLTCRDVRNEGLVDQQVRRLIERDVCFDHPGQRPGERELPPGKEDDLLYMRYYASLAKAWIMAGLFHDLGYPIMQFRRSGRELNRHFPHMPQFESMTGTGAFEDIEASLGTSMFFRIIDKREIRKRYIKDDHGTLSAIGFLMFFYDSGRINRLPPVEQAAVEMAAIAIFTHTTRTLRKKDGPRTVVAHLSYQRFPHGLLLQLVDDLQEWSRTYFEVSGVDALTLCARCQTPLLRISREGELTPTLQRSMKPGFVDPWNEEARMPREPGITLDTMIERDMQPMSTERCWCDIVDSGRLDSDAKPNDWIPSLRSEEAYDIGYHLMRYAVDKDQLRFRGGQRLLTTFSQQRIYRIELVDAALILTPQWTHKNATLTDVFAHSMAFFEPYMAGDAQRVLQLNYRLKHMLDIIMIDHTFATFRIKEINRVKYMLDAQIGFPQYTIDFFLTSNPLWLKTQILWNAIAPNEAALEDGRIEPADWVLEGMEYFKMLLEENAKAEDIYQCIEQVHEAIQGQLEHHLRACYSSGWGCRECLSRVEGEDLDRIVNDVYRHVGNPGKIGLIKVQIRELFLSLCASLPDKSKDVSIHRLRAELKRMEAAYSEKAKEDDVRDGSLFVLQMEILGAVRRWLGEKGSVKRLKELLPRRACTLHQVRDKVIQSRVTGNYGPLMLLYLVELTVMECLKRGVPLTHLGKLLDSMRTWIYKNAASTGEEQWLFNQHTPEFKKDFAFFHTLVRSMINQFFIRPAFCAAREKWGANDEHPLEVEHAYTSLYMGVSKRTERKRDEELTKLHGDTRLHDDVVGMYMRKRWYADEKEYMYPDYYTDLAFFYYMERKATRALNAARRLFFPAADV